MPGKPDYYPITATPLKSNDSYQEILPCAPLRPYIRCFWGNAFPYHAGKNKPADIVIPDTCTDIMYCIDYTANQVTGSFCGINDASFYAQSHFAPGHMAATFCIRFYAWTAYKFSEDGLKDTANGFYDIRPTFSWLDRELRDNLFDLPFLQQKIAFTEKLFLKKMEHMRTNSAVDHAMNFVLAKRGNLEIAQLSKDVFLSSRQLERIFHEYVGITPKKLSSLVRYQSLWQDILRNPGFDVLDAVQQYGYTDQSHLTKDFRRYHSMDIRSAIKLAMGNSENMQKPAINDVENIQENVMFF